MNDQHRELRSDKANTRELVLLIHGTFAARPEDGGDAWWQCQSRFARALDSHCRPLAITAGEGEVFHWSGQNTERARRLAGINLLRRLLEPERAGRHYHLVAHSHGGSVVWAALMMSVNPVWSGESFVSSDQIGLPHLLSWTTVGTPFLRVGADALRYDTVVRALLFFGLSVIRFFASLVAMLGWLFALASVAWGRVAGSDALVQWGVWIVVTWIAAVPVSIVSALTLMRLSEGAGAIVEELARRWACFLFVGRWLPIWSEHDEALNGLQSTRWLGGKLLPRIDVDPVLTDVQYSDAFRPGRRHLRAIFAIFNRFVAPVIDTFVWGVLRRAAQGNDRTGIDFADVSSVPDESLSSVLPLPDVVTSALLTHADSAAAESASRLRVALGQVAVSGVGILKSNESWADGALVHTSYFRDSNVQQIIAYHITLMSSSLGDPQRAHVIRPFLPLETGRWYQQQRVRIGQILKEWSALLEPTKLQRSDACTLKNMPRFYESARSCAVSASCRQQLRCSVPD